MARFKKLVGTHYRKESGKEVEYKPGSIIEATEAELRVHDISLATWRMLDELVAVAIEASKVDEPAGFKVVKIKGTQGFNVINTATNEPINDTPLSREDAFSLVKGKKQVEIER